jgi:flagellum-specific peptidoglycan hydrolase FlgJ
MTLDQEIYNTAISEGFSPTSAKLIVAQARLESGHYESNAFLTNNNMYGMKYIGQPLATRGSLAPMNERSASCRNGGSCNNSDHYAKYKSPSDSAKDVIQRLYKKTRNGIGFNELRDVKDANEFANKLKTRNYFGFHDINTPEGQAEADAYARVLKSIILRIKVLEFYQENKKTINYGMIAFFMLSLSAISYWYYKKNYLK